MATATTPAQIWGALTATAGKLESGVNQAITNINARIYGEYADIFYGMAGAILAVHDELWGQLGHDAAGIQPSANHVAMAAQDSIDSLTADMQRVHDAFYLRLAAQVEALAR